MYQQVDLLARIIRIPQFKIFNSSHAEGQETIASTNHQHVQGKYNVEDTEGKYADIIGGGSDKSHRINIEATDWEGNKYLKGNIYVNCNNDSTGGY